MAANDVRNTTDGTTSGNAKNGALIVNPGGVEPNITNTSRSPVFVDTTAISVLTVKYDERLDDPRYYTGDAAT